MQSSSVPSKFNIPFANGAGSSYIRPIPQASQIGITNGAASLTDGFPPNSFVAVAAGGAPPFGQDFNGLLNLVTKWNQWQQAGAPIVYDSTFQSAIGGYPAGAIIQISAGGPEFMSTVDNNTVAPAVGAAGWMPAPTFGANVTTVLATGSLTANNAGLIVVNASSGNITITMPAAASENGVPLPFEFVRVDTSSNSVTLQVAGSDNFWPGATTTYSLAANTAATFLGNGFSAWYLTRGNFFAGANTWTGANTFSGTLQVLPSVQPNQAVQQSQVVGVGQTLTNVTGSRLFATTYTNSTGRPIVVYVSALTTAIGGGLSISLNGQYAAFSTDPGAIGSVVAVNALIPAGATYIVGSVSAALSYWQELR